MCKLTTSVLLCNTAAFQHFIHSPVFPPSLCSYFTSILFLVDKPQKKQLNKSCLKWEKQEKVYFEVLKDFSWLFVSRRLQFQAQFQTFEATDSLRSEEAGKKELRYFLLCTAADKNLKAFYVQLTSWQIWVFKTQTSTQTHTEFKSIHTSLPTARLKEN